MEVRKKALRVGALSAIMFSGSAIVLNGSAFAGPAAPPDPRPHPGHVHIEDHLKVNKGQDIKHLYQQCAVAVRPHRYQGYDASTATFTVNAVGRKPTTTAPIATTLNNG